jgi:hypothetical protein
LDFVGRSRCASNSFYSATLNARDASGCEQAPVFKILLGIWRQHSTGSNLKHAKHRDALRAWMVQSAARVLMLGVC